MKKHFHYTDFSDLDLGKNSMSRMHQYRREYIWSSFLPTVLLLMVAITATLITISFLSNDSKLLTSSLTGGAETVSRSELNEAVQKSKTEIEALERNLEQLQLAIETSGDNNLIDVERRLAGFDQRVELIEGAVLESPGKAITASLLTERQKDITLRMTQIEDNQRRLSERLDSFLSAALLVPAVSVIFAIIIAIITPFITRILTRFGVYSENMRKASKDSDG